MHGIQVYESSNDLNICIKQINQQI